MSFTSSKRKNTGVGSMFDHLPDFQDRFRSIVKESYPGELPRSKPRQNARQCLTCQQFADADEILAYHSPLILPNLYCLWLGQNIDEPQELR